MPAFQHSSLISDMGKPVNMNAVKVQTIEKLSFNVAYVEGRFSHPNKKLLNTKISTFLYCKNCLAFSV